MNFIYFINLLKVVFQPLDTIDTYSLLTTKRGRNREISGIPIHLRNETIAKKKRKMIKQNAKKYKKKLNLKIEVRSLTCLFVYKVLNQEVLDDRGKFEVSL